MSFEHSQRGRARRRRARGGPGGGGGGEPGCRACSEARRTAQGGARRSAPLVAILAALFVAISPIASASPAAAATSPSSKAAIAYFYQTVLGDCASTTDSLVLQCLDAWDYETIARFDYYGFFDEEPEITLAMLQDEIAGAGFVYIASRGMPPRDSVLAPPYDLVPPVYLPPSLGGDVGSEWYMDLSDAIAAAYAYLDDPQCDWSPGDLWVFGVEDLLWNYWAVVLSPRGIAQHLDELASGAIVHAQFDWSAAEPRRALASARTFLGYDGSLLDVDECAEAGALYSRLSCAGYPMFESRVGSAAAGLDLRLFGDADNWMDADRSCENLATLFRNVRARQAPGGSGVALSFDAESDGMAQGYRVRGYRTVADYPTRPVPLARLAARPDMRGAGPRGASEVGANPRRRYGARIPSGFALYDVLEEGGGARGSWSEPVRVAGESGTAAGHPVLDAGEFEDDPVDAARGDAADDGEQDAGRRDLASIAGARQRDRAAGALAAAEALPAPPISAASPCEACADYVVYVNGAYAEWAVPVRDSLAALGFDVAVFAGPSSLIAARAPLASTRDANAAWNATCALAPPCERLYPVDPGPTLVVVGDASPVIVSPMSFPNPTQCLGSNCRSYVLVADLDADSIPDCPVEVIPANTLDEVLRAAAAAADVCRGRDLDAAGRVALVGGDRDAGGVSPWVGEFLDETAALYPTGSIAAGAPILESAFPIGDGYTGIQTATRDAINAGVAEAWFFGLRTDELKYPAWCVSGLSDPVNLTRRQRFIVWAPGCRMGAVQSYDPSNYNQPPTSEKLAFNDASKSVMAGGVFHLDPGYSVKHMTWSRILRDARASAAAGSPISRIHYDAVRAWCSQFPGDRYALSTVTLGGRVVLADAATAVPRAGDALGGARAGLDGLATANSPGIAPSFRFTLRAPARGALRVVDTSGRVVTTLREGELPAGDHRYTWFGRARDGRRVAAGVYFGVLRTTDGRNDVAKVVIVR